MPIHNADIARTFEEIADLLEIQGENPFRVRAYRTAARTLSEVGQDIPSWVQTGQDLTRLPGIGKDLADKIREIVQTGHSRALDELHGKIPAAVAELLKIPGLGPKRVHALYSELDIRSTEQLRQAALAGRIRELPGFGEKTEKHILDTIKATVTTEGRLKLAVAKGYADTLQRFLKHVPGVKQVVVAGSYRRYKETVGDLDVLVTGANGREIIDRFVQYGEIKEVVAHGTTRATVILHAGLQVDVRVVEEKSFGAALHYFTGSKAHNIAIRRLGQQRGLKINEYGVFKDDEYVTGKTEESVFESVGLPFIPPELRENRGEVEAAQEKALPDLIRLDDLKGDLHCHSKAANGQNSIEEMALAAQRNGLTYLAITDPWKRLITSQGRDDARMRAQWQEIDRINHKLEGFRLLKGIEADILEDGSLDVPDTILNDLELIVCVLNSHFNLSRMRQTERILRAMDHPGFTLLAHPTGRILDQREPMDVDMTKIIRKAKERGCFLELNAQPDRLDLLDIYCRMAKDEGVPVAINSDARSTNDFANLRYGIGQARRGWLERNDVLNTRPVSKLLPLLRKAMGR